MHSISCVEAFHAESMVHVAAIGVLTLAAMIVIRYGKHAGIDTPQLRDRIDKKIAAVLLFICLIEFLRNLRADRIGWDNLLPLYICDITGFVAALAIQTRWPLARCVLHFWGLALCSQAFFFPVVEAGPIHSDFWL